MIFSTYFLPHLKLLEWIQGIESEYILGANYILDDKLEETEKLPCYPFEKDLWNHRKDPMGNRDITKNNPSFIKCISRKSFP